MKGKVEEDEDEVAGGARDPWLLYLFLSTSKHPLHNNKNSSSHKLYYVQAIYANLIPLLSHFISQFAGKRQNFKATNSLLQKGCFFSVWKRHGMTC